MTQSGTFLFLHTVVILAVSFFVLVVARKQDAQAMKAFGYTIAVLLWLCAAGVFFKVVKTFYHFNKASMGQIGCSKTDVNRQNNMPMPESPMKHKMPN
jgi:hypothetical protein